MPTNVGVLKSGLREAVLKVTGSNSKLTYLPMPEDEQTQRRSDISKAQRLLGWTPEVLLAGGLQKSLEYFWQKL